MAENKTDEVNAGGNGGNNPPPQKYRINGFYVKDISFESPNSPKVFTEQPKQPKLDLSLDVLVGKVDGSAFEVALKVNANAIIADEPDRSLFLVEVIYGGLFVLNPDLQKEELEKILFVDCAADVFPYARRIVSELTRDGGFMPLTMEPIDFALLYEQKKAAKPE